MPRLQKPTSEPTAVNVSAVVSGEWTVFHSLLSESYAIHSVKSSSENTGEAATANRQNEASVAGTVPYSFHIRLDTDFCLKDGCSASRVRFRSVLATTRGTPYYSLDASSFYAYRVSI